MQDLTLWFSPGFADDAKMEKGYISQPDRPGNGFEAQNALYAVMRDVAAG